MSLEKLMNKGKKGMATLGILGMLGCIGCSTLTEGEVATVAGEVLTEKGKSELERLAGRLLLSVGTMKYQKELAEAGRTQIVLENTIYREGGYVPKEGYTWTNPKDPGDPKVKPILGSGFAFRWVDYNKSGNMDNADEIIERRNRFRQNESICLWLFYEAEKPFIQNLKIYGPGGKMILEDEMDPFQKKVGEKQYSYYLGNPEKLAKIHEVFWEWTKEYEEGSNRGMAIALSGDYIEKDFLKKHGEGEYSAVWRVNGKIMDSITFDIIY